MGGWAFGWMNGKLITLGYQIIDGGNNWEGWKILES